MAKEKDKNKERVGIWGRFMNFCHGVKSESKRVHWTSKSDLVKYSIATFVFVLFFSVFFYIIDFLFALVHSLLG